MVVVLIYRIKMAESNSKAARKNAHVQNSIFERPVDTQVIFLKDLYITMHCFLELHGFL